MLATLRPLYRFLRPVVAAAVVAWMASHTDLGVVAAELGSVNPLWLSIAVSIGFAEAVIRCANWQQVLTAIGIRIPTFGGLLRKYFLAAFAGSLIPSSLGTDALRAVFSRQLAGGGRLSQHALAVFVTNILSFAGGMLLILTSLAWLTAGQQHRLANAFAVSLIGLLCIAVFGLLGALPFRLKGTLVGMAPLSRKFRSRLLRTTARLSRDFRRIASNGPAIGIGILLALIAQAAGYAVVAYAAGVEMPAAAWLIVPALVALVGMLPASFLGFGATQAAIVGVLLVFDQREEQAIAASTLMTLVGLFVKLAGGLVATLAEPRPA